MALLIDVRKLTQNLLSDYDARLKAVADLRSDVKQELSDFRAAHMAMTTEQQHQLGDYLNSLHCEVVEAGRATERFLVELDKTHQAMTIEQRQQLNQHIATLHSRVADASQATVDFLKEISQEHQTMTVEQQQWMKEQLDSLHRQVSDLRHAAAAFLGEMDSANQSMAAELGKKLSDQRSQLASETAGFLSDVNDAFHITMSEQDKQLNEQMENLRKNVENLRSEIINFLKDVAAGHQSMAADQQKHFSTDRTKLSKEVTATRQKNQAQQKAAQSDLREAHHEWANFHQLKDQQRLQQGFKKPSKESEISSKENAILNKPVVQGDLTVINGIGPGMARLLNQAGISSIEQLAISQPATVRQALGKAARLAKVESWIAQANNLSS